MFFLQKKEDMNENISTDLLTPLQKVNLSLKLLRDGKSARSIAESLNISTNTIRK